MGCYSCDRFWLLHGRSRLYDTIMVTQAALVAEPLQEAQFIEATGKNVYPQLNA